jgi:hypothetical protein
LDYKISIPSTKSSFHLHNFLTSYQKIPTPLTLSSPILGLICSINMFESTVFQFLHPKPTRNQFVFLLNPRLDIVHSHIVGTDKMSCQLKRNEVTVFVCFIELNYKHGGSNYTQSPIKLISIPTSSSLVSPLSFATRHSLCTRFVLFFDSLDVNTVLENENIYPLLPS